MTPMNWGVSAPFGRSGSLGRLRGQKCIQSTCTFWGGVKALFKRTSSARFLTVSRESFEVTVSGGSTFARVKLKEIDGMAPQDVERAV